MAGKQRLAGAGTRPATALAASLTASQDEAPADPVTAVKHTLPAGVIELIDAFTAATRGGRQVTEGTLKNTQDRMSVALKDFTDALAACEEDYRVDWEPGAVVTVHVIDDEGRKPVSTFARRVDERAKDQGILLEDRERKVLEDELLAALASQIHTRVVAARDLTRNMNADTRAKPMSSGISIGIRWAQSDKITDAQRAASRLLDRDQPGPERLAELRGILRDMIREYRAAHPRATYREALAAVLDYRGWHAFELLLVTPGEGEARLTRAKHSVMSGGEKSAAIHLPLFAAANALYSSAKDQCPRLIALDEAFVGIDERYKPDLFGLAVKFDLDLFMTGHDLWVTTATVPMIAHYDLYHDKVTRTTSALLLLWDGQQLIDATAGFRTTRPWSPNCSASARPGTRPWARTPPSTCPPWTQIRPALRTTKTDRPRWCYERGWLGPRSARRLVSPGLPDSLASGWLVQQYSGRPGEEFVIRVRRGAGVLDVPVRGGPQHQHQPLRLVHLANGVRQLAGDPPHCCLHRWPPSVLCLQARSKTRR